MEALDLHVEHRGGVQIQPLLRPQQAAQAVLVLLLHLQQAGEHRRVVFILQQALQLLGVPPPVGADAVVDKGHQRLVAGLQPPAEGDAVCFVGELLGIDVIEGFQLRVLQYLGVQPGHAVDGEAIVDVQVGHVDPILIVDDGHPGVGVGGLGPLVQFTEDGAELGSRGVQIGHGPGLQGLGQNRVVGIGAGRRHLVRRLVKGQAPVHQQPHQLRDDHRGVGVVDLDDHVVGQGVRGKAPLLQLRQNELSACGHQEILLIHPQQPPGLVAVVGIEEGGQVVPDVPFVKVDAHPGGVGGVGQVEQVQPIGAAAARPGDGDVIHDRRHLGIPQRDGERALRLDEPAVRLEPGVRLLRLLAPGEHLAEQAEVII